MQTKSLFVGLILAVCFGGTIWAQEPQAPAVPGAATPPAPLQLLLRPKS